MSDTYIYYERISNCMDQKTSNWSINETKDQEHRSWESNLPLPIPEKYKPEFVKQLPKISWKKQARFRETQFWKYELKKKIPQNISAYVAFLLEVGVLLLK